MRNYLGTRRKWIVFFILLLLAIVVALMFYPGYRKTKAMKQYEKDLKALPYVTDVSYKLNGRIHSCKSVFSINLYVQSSNVESKEQVFYDCINLLVKDSQLEEDLLGIEAQRYSFVLYDENETYIDVISTDIYPYSLREWYSSDNIQFLYTNEGLEIQSN